MLSRTRKAGGICHPGRHDYASSPGMPSGSPKHALPTGMVMPVHPACPPTVQSPKHAAPTGMIMPVHPACPPTIQSMPPRPAWSCRFTRHALRQSKACRPDRHGHASSPGMPSDSPKSKACLPDRHGHASSPGMPSGSPKHAAPTSMVMPVHPACPPTVQSMPLHPACPPQK